MSRSLRALANGEKVDLIRFRRNDFWQEMADEFNNVAIYVEKLKNQAADAGKSPRNDSREKEVVSAR